MQVLINKFSCAKEVYKIAIKLWRIVIPCQCRCEVCASGPPATSEANAPPIGDSLGCAVVPFAPSNFGQGTPTGLTGFTGAGEPPTETSTQPSQQTASHARTMVDVGCDCHHDHHRGVSCTTRRRVRLSYLNEDSENAMLCEGCYPQPLRLVASQIRLTPCQCRCEVCAPGPPQHQRPTRPPSATL